MQLLSVNIGEARSQSKGIGVETTGIFKLPVRGSVKVTHLGIPADFIGDSKHHGGPDQAVYVYGMEDYAWWSMTLERELMPGTFGENLTVAGLASADYGIGDRLQIGSVVLEVTAPRSPCGTLARRMGDRLFVRKYLRAERPGLYCRVIEDGSLQQGDSVVLRPALGDRLGVLELFRSHHRRDKDEATLLRFLQAPIAIRDRQEIESHVRKLQGGS